MKQKILKWLLGDKLDKAEVEISKIKKQEQKLIELEEEIRRLYKFIGALYEYLDVWPQKKFVEDFSRLPDERLPVVEVIKAQKINKIKADIKRD